MRFARSRWRPAIVLTLVATTGCGVPSSEQVVSALSAVVLQPERSCADLRVDFGLEFLPVVANPGEIGLTYEEHYEQAPNGNLFRIWYLPSRDDLGVVVLSPGIVGEIACYLVLALILVENGWTVVMYDYEGFGGSEGVASLDTIIGDLDVALDWTLARTGRPQVTLVGQSIGSAPSIAVAVRRPQDVNAVILDSPVATVTLSERLNGLAPGLGSYLLSAFDPELASETLITQMTTPLLVFMHEADTITPPDTVEYLFSLAPGPKQIVRFPGLNHFRGVFLATEVYTYYLQSFLLQEWTGLPLPDLVPDLIDAYRNGFRVPTPEGGLDPRTSEDLLQGEQERDASLNVAG